jgi:arylsulfatase A-like enzyme
MSTRRLGIAAGCVLLAGVGLVAWRQRGPAPSARPQGVILWVIDTCRADHLSMYGSARRTSPFLDKLGREGTVFERCFAQAPWTKPSMAALFSGRYPSSVGVYGILDRLPDDVETLPEAMAGAGYRAAGFSANPIVGRLSNYAQGFDEFVEAMQILPSATVDAYASGSAAAINRHVLPWLTAIGTQPFFLFIQSMDPHEQYKPARTYLDQFADPADEARYRRDWQALKDAQPKQLSNHCTMQTFTDAGVDPAWFVDYGQRLYDADILASDAAIEEFWHHLEALGLSDRVIFVVTADHGEEFLEHGGTSHGFSLYNEMLHVPLIIRAPGLVPTGRRVPDPVRLIDIYPTVLTLAGIPLPPGLEGESLPGLTDGAADGAARTIYAEKREAPDTPLGRYRTGTAVGVIEWPWKLVLNPLSATGLNFPPRELYHLERDPEEAINLAAEDVERTEAMAASLIDWSDRPEARPANGPGVQEPPPPDVVERLRQLGYAQ